MNSPPASSQSVSSQSVSSRSALPTSARAELSRLLGPHDLLTDADLRAGYEVDWTRRYQGSCSAVLRPRTTAQVAEILQICSAHHIEVITQGGNTGLVGGGVPRPHSSAPVVVLSTRGLVQLGPIDHDAMQVTVEAGVTLAQWRAHARSHGVDVPVDFAARDSATIGGAIATNAGGSRVVRFGTMRSQVAGIEAVTIGGEVIGSLSGLPKETVGPHLPSVLAGSEGTLAVITRARLRLVPLFSHSITALVALTSLNAAVQMLGRVRASLGSLDSVELILPGAMDLVSAHLGRRPPVAAGGAYVMIECADHMDPSDDLLMLLSDLDGVVDSAVATEGPTRDQLMEFRDRITEAINAAGVPYKLDVAVPVTDLAHLMEVAHEAATTHGGRLIPFGHLAEGNVHLNYLDVKNPAGIAERVLTAVAAVGGTISAEHGVGIAKGPWLPLVRTAAELALMEAMRLAWDPQGLLNPGVLDPGIARVHQVP
jgi:FAD/FMN-containing dehydrogenase